MSKGSRIAFNKRALETLPLPLPGEKARYFDSRTPGLALRVYGPPKTDPGAPGRKAFVFLRRVNGVLGQRTLGLFPAMTVDQARTQVGELNAAIYDGANPFDQARAQREELTLKGLFDLFLAQHVEPKRKDQTAHDYRALFGRYVESLGRRRLSAIKRQHVRSLHLKIGEKAPISANRTLTMLRTVFNWGLKCDYWEGENPAAGIAKFKEKSRSKFLQGDEIPRFFEALSQEKNQTMRDFFLVALLTGARKANVMAMRWEELHLDRATWTIPETKNGSSQVVTLPVQAVELLRDRAARMARVFPDLDVFHPGSWRRIRRRMQIQDLGCVDETLQAMRWDELDLARGIWNAPTGRKILPPPAAEALRDLSRSRQYVFPGPGDTGHLKDPKKGWSRLLERAGLRSENPRADLRIHDLRRSLGSWQAMTGASLVMIGKSLGHKSVQATAIYAHLNQDPVRQSVQTAVDAIFERAKEKPAAEVVEIKTGAGRRGER